MQCRSHKRLEFNPWVGKIQARILEWVAMPSSKGSSRPRYQTHIPYVACIGRRVLNHSLVPPGKPGSKRNVPKIAGDNLIWHRYVCFQPCTECVNSDVPWWGIEWLIGICPLALYSLDLNPFCATLLVAYLWESYLTALILFFLFIKWQKYRFAFCIQ